MSMSVDYAQLETFSKFSGFLEVIQDPKSFKDMLTQAQSILDEEKARRGPRLVLDKAEQYRDKVYADCDKKEADFVLKQSEWDLLVEKRTKELSDEKDRVTGLQNELRSKVTEQVGLNAALKKKDSELAAALSSVDQERESLAKQIQDYRDAEASLQEKAAKIQAVLGG